MVAASAIAAVLRSYNLCPELEGITVGDSDRIARRMAQQARTPLLHSFSASLA